MMYTYNLITIYKIIYYNFIVISYILYLHIIHKKFLYMSPRKLTWISKMTPYLLPEIHFFQNRTCLFVFFKIFRGLIYIMYIYIYMYLSTASTGSLSIQLLVIKLQSPTTPNPYVRLPTSARRPSRAERFTLAASSLGTIKRWKPANGWGFFPPYPNWKKNALQIEAYVFLFVSLSQGSGFLWFFFVFWRIPLKAPVPFEAYEAFFFKKGSFHRGQIFQ